jgi:hypothetical protein
MGMSKLDEIVALFQNEQREMPVAIIQMGLRQRKSRNWDY